MAQQHLDRLSALDAAFLHQESTSTHMHIGGVATFEGPPPSYEQILDHIDSRLHLVPRYRQKLAVPPLQSGRPLWVDDPTFNLEYHVRQTALPAPGGEDELTRLTARIFSQQLDRTKPLWELWLVNGHRGKKFALISKTHHCLVDGVSGSDLMTILFDLDRTPADLDVPPPPAWAPGPPPGGPQLVASGLAGAVKAGVETVARVAAAATHPAATAAALAEAATGIAEVAWSGLNPAPKTPINVEIGPHRRYVGVGMELADFKKVKDAFGGTVNDVVLAVVAGALRDFMHSRGQRVEGLELRAAVPISIRSDDEQGDMGNRLAQLMGPLPLYIADPVARLRHVKAAMDGLKSSKQALGAEVIAGMEDFAPPTILAQASRLNFSNRFYNLLVTNIPGPQFPLFMLGRRMQGLYPVPFLAGSRALAIAIMSYDGAMNFGLLGDYDALPDIEEVAAGLRAALAELVEAAAA